MKINKLNIPIVLFALALSSCNRTQETLPQRKDIVDVVFASGSIIMENNYLITSQAEGILSESYVSEGDSVKNDEVLFRIQNDAQEALEQSSAANYQYAESNTDKYSPVWKKLQLQHNQLSDQLINDSVQYERYKKLYETHAVSKAELDKMELVYKKTKSDLLQLESTMADTKKTLALETMNAKAGYLTQQTANNQYVLKSQYNGVVLSAPKIPGELVKRGETIAQIGAGKYLAKLLISESDINKVRVGQEVMIELNTDKNNACSALITKVYPAFDLTEQSFVAEAEFTVFAPDLRVGTQLQANIVVGESKNALVIPSEYIAEDNTVIDAKSNQVLVVKTGIRTPEWVEITAGINDSAKLKLKRNGGK